MVFAHTKVEEDKRPRPEMMREYAGTEGTESAQHFKAGMAEDFGSTETLSWPAFRLACESFPKRKTFLGLRLQEHCCAKLVRVGRVE